MRFLKKHLDGVITPRADLKSCAGFWRGRSGSDNHTNSYVSCNSWGCLIPGAPEFCVRVRDQRRTGNTQGKRGCACFPSPPLVSNDRVAPAGNSRALQAERPHSADAGQLRAAVGVTQWVIAENTSHAHGPRPKRAFLNAAVPTASAMLLLAAREALSSHVTRPERGAPSGHPHQCTRLHQVRAAATTGSSDYGQRCGALRCSHISHLALFSAFVRVRYKEKLRALPRRRSVAVVKAACLLSGAGTRDGCGTSV